MDHSPVDRASGRFRSTIEMLEMLESVLGSVSEAIDEAAEIEFAPRYRRIAREFAYSVIGAEGEPDDEQRDDFEELFDAAWSWNQFEKHQDGAGQREVVDDLTDFCRWIGQFELKLSGTTGGSLEGLTRGVVDTMEEIGEVFAVGPTAKERLEATTSAARDVVDDLGLAQNG